MGPLLIKAAETFVSGDINFLHKQYSGFGTIGDLVGVGVRVGVGVFVGVRVSRVGLLVGVALGAGSSHKVRTTCPKLP